MIYFDNNTHTRILCTDETFKYVFSLTCRFVISFWFGDL